MMVSKIWGMGQVKTRMCTILLIILILSIGALGGPGLIINNINPNIKFYYLIASVQWVLIFIIIYINLRR